MRSRLRTYFVAGLIVFLPVAITFSIIIWLFRLVDSFLGWALPSLFGWAFPGLGLALSVLVILVIGALATNVLGRRVVGFFERLMLRIPLARSIYSATNPLATPFSCSGGRRSGGPCSSNGRVRGGSTGSASSPERSPAYPRAGP